MTKNVANHNKDASTRAVKARNKVQDVKRDVERDAEQVEHTAEAVEAHVRQVKALLAARGLSFPKVGAHIVVGKKNPRKGITGWAVSQIIRGERPNSPLFGHIAAVIGVPVDEIKPPWLRASDPRTT